MSEHVCLRRTEGWNGKNMSRETTIKIRALGLCATRRLRGGLVGVFLLAVLSGCAREPAPVYVPAPSTFDRAWNAALGAVRDEGVQVMSEDRAAGTISGSKGDQEVTIGLRSQADGSVRIEFSQRGPKSADPGLAQRISRAYDRRMGR